MKIFRLIKSRMTAALNSRHEKSLDVSLDEKTNDEQSNNHTIHSDQPSADDHFDYKSYVDVFHGVITDSKLTTPITIGIYGRWGVGKTTLLMLLDKKLRESRVTTIWFNAWQYSVEDHMWAALLQVILNSLYSNLGFRQRLRFEYNMIIKQIDWQAWPNFSYEILKKTSKILIPLSILFLITEFIKIDIVDSVKEHLRTIGLIYLTYLEILKPALKKLRDTFELDLNLYYKQHTYQEKIAYFDKFNKHLSDVINSISRNNDRKVVVFIDDLDRCAPDKTIQVLDAIKMFLGVKNVCYVLGLDADLVQKAIAIKYPEDPIAQQEYIAKIIQLPFELPSLTSERIGYFVDKLLNNIQQLECKDVFVKGMTANPREIKRALNSLTLVLMLASIREDLTGTIDPLLLAKIIVLQITYKAFYRICAEKPWLLPALIKHFKQDNDDSTNIEFDELKSYVIDKKLRQMLLVGTDDHIEKIVNLNKDDLSIYFSYVRTQPSIITVADIDQGIPANDFREQFANAFEQRINLDHHQLDERFVNLTLMIDKGEVEVQRWERQSLQSISEIIRLNEEYSVMVILGAPGSGKSTILRRLEIDYYRQQKEEGKRRLSFFVPLNRYIPGSMEKPVDPMEFLESMWGNLYGDTGITLKNLLMQGEMLLLLDAVNEIQYSSKADYHQLIKLWREFAIDQKKGGNRIIFSCRSLDYSQSLSSPEMRVPNVELQPLTVEKIREFLQVYQPVNHAKVFEEIKKTGTLEFYNNPYFLSLLCKQIGKDGEVPKGRASLFTGYVRSAIKREMESDLFKNAGFLSKADRLKLTNNQWVNAFQLPVASELLGRLSHLAYEMQQSGQRKENKQVSIGLDEALELIATERAEKILEAGFAITVLDHDIGGDEVKYYHQLLQEYFAGRRLAEEPKPELVRVEWRASEVRPTLAETIASLANGDPLPPPGQTGWEETTLAALPMAKDPEGYIRMLMEENLPLAARCAISAEVVVKEELKEEIRAALIGRTQEMKADLRARIAAGDALGLIGDPRWKEIRNERGSCLKAPMVRIAAGRYPIGDDHSGFANEGPAHEVELKEYEIGVFPVTNAEYARFIEAGGYEEEGWWETREAKRWLSEGGSESQKQSLRDERSRWQNNWTDDGIRALVGQNRATPQQVESWLWVRNSSDEEFESALAQVFPGGVLYRQPLYWEDSAYNNQLQPVVGVSWYEARAYCKWLSEVTGEEYRLPTEVEYEAAARGAEGRKYAYGEEFDSAKCNTFESHIRRPTPVGICENRTPEGAYDLTGNVWTWTTTIYDEEKYGYPYQAEDGREELEERVAGEEGSGGERSGQAANRVFRGGSWNGSAVLCRSADRGGLAPGVRDGAIGFRLSRTLPSAFLPSRRD
jgi:formylglycine-generating enzyme required for sulfatase activity/GTPase SAR1 family protein